MLDFKILQFLSCRPYRHVVLLPHTKFRWNWTINRWIMAKKPIFKMAAAAILNFKNFNFWSIDFIGFIICCSVPNFIKIGWFFTEIWWFSDFQNGGRPPAWICYDVTILHRRTHFRCPNVVLEFLFDRWCSFRDTCNIVRQPFGCTQRTMAILGLRMRCITWPLVEGSKITTRMKFLTPICLFTMPLLGVYEVLEEHPCF